jgi:diaminohydroxyphosphoribosylaminopyrimidine deaminase/5-amino-6-(5-phosphoribosylamino)uracil reductase
MVVYQAPAPAGGEGMLPFVSEGLDRLTETGHFTLTFSRFFGPDRMTWWRRKLTCSPELSPT